MGHCQVLVVVPTVLVVGSAAVLIEDQAVVQVEPGNPSIGHHP
jgi:hypothetical protein